MTQVSEPTEATAPRPAPDDAGSTLPLILGFFLIALIMVAGSVALGEAFVQQRDLQAACDGAAASAAASAGDLDRSAKSADGQSLKFADVQAVIDAYLARDPDRHGMQIGVRLSPDHERIMLSCAQRTSLALGAFFGRGHVTHTATSEARAAVVP